MLGFEVKELQDGGNTALSEMWRGPARIHIGRDRTGSTGILFFETSDVEAMRADVAARGGKPGSIERVNWIKMAMFEVRDPDGHGVWFGKSFAEPGKAESPSPLFQQIMPELPFTDVSAAIAHYRDLLGFVVNYAQHDLGVMDRDKVRILLIARGQRHKGIGSAYVYVSNADDLYAELLSKGARVQGQPISQPWGLREFSVLDPEDNRITFGQPFE